MKKATKKEIIQKSLEMYEKYNKLVWYARTTPDRLSIPGVKEAIEQLEINNPNELKSLEEDDSNWTHGFNSGCSAAFHYILSLSDYGIEHADEEFPNLDT
jgi:hypothetical protein